MLKAPKPPKLNKNLNPPTSEQSPRTDIIRSDRKSRPIIHPTKRPIAKRPLRTATETRIATRQTDGQQGKESRLSSQYEASPKISDRRNIE